MDATPNQTARRLSSMASTSAPAGIWLTRLQIVPMVRAKPISAVVQRFSVR
jgi:hypothetical protein